ncbi:hypothetical protein NEHOM01_1586 [Nematocida homosporus]|uniref:uncharacterized protein n=1 Tax=Nematocida homosporus TaxID=1912981 RepID=UPI0022207BA2|nr:uncharacterized protein NEHOM01_1586 [Nematocida homosporus]KAI5186618.1 hypothetical protein NEHOM01_1586 [Nematocida homosporus]
MDELAQRKEIDQKHVRIDKVKWILGYVGCQGFKYLEYLALGILFCLWEYTHGHLDSLGLASPTNSTNTTTDAVFSRMQPYPLGQRGGLALDPSPSTSPSPSTPSIVAPMIYPWLGLIAVQIAILLENLMGELIVVLGFCWLYGTTIIEYLSEVLLKMHLFICLGIFALMASYFLLDLIIGIYPSLLLPKTPIILMADPEEGELTMIPTAAAGDKTKTFGRCIGAATLLTSRILFSLVILGVKVFALILIVISLLGGFNIYSGLIGFYILSLTAQVYTYLDAKFNPNLSRSFPYTLLFLHLLFYIGVLNSSHSYQLLQYCSGQAPTSWAYTICDYMNTFNAFKPLNTLASVFGSE